MSNSRLSAAGAANMRFNAQTHGLTSKQAVIRGEDPAAYERLRQDLFEEYQPATRTEATLVDQLAKNDWRLQRAHKIEILTFNFEIDGLFPEAKTYPAAAPAMALQIGGKNLDQVRRYMTAIERSYFRTLKELQHARQLRFKSTVSQNSKTLESLFWHDPPAASQNAASASKATTGTTPAPRETSSVPEPSPAVSQNAEITSEITMDNTAAAQPTPSPADQPVTVSQNPQVIESVLANHPATLSQNGANPNGATMETTPGARRTASIIEPRTTVSQNPADAESLPATLLETGKTDPSGLLNERS
jgi:hypothetical protein